MTYILGSKCKDGVVLIGDRKVTSEDGTEFDYEDKVFMDVGNIVIGSSGVGALFEKFRHAVAIYVKTRQPEPKPLYDEFVTEIEKVTGELNKKYREVVWPHYFEVLVAVKTADIGSILQHVLSGGIAEPVKKYKAIGHGEPYGKMYLKHAWRPDMTMDQVAEIGYFIVKSIEIYGLDGSVGVGDNKPQIWFLPDDPQKSVTQADMSILERLEEVTAKRLKQFKSDIEGFLKPSSYA